VPETSTGIAFDVSRVAGGSDRLVFIHAGVGDRRMWQPQWNRLSGDHDLIIDDHR
jgi:hypothetical protein